MRRAPLDRHLDGDDRRRQAAGDIAAGEGTLHRVCFGTDRRPLVGASGDGPGHQSGLTGAQAFAPSGGVQSATFFVSRIGPSATATVPPVVTDDRGDCETFVGMGTEAR